MFENSGSAKIWLAIEVGNPVIDVNYISRLVWQ